MIYDDDYDEEEKRLEDYDDEDDETTHSNDFDLQGFPVHEAVAFFHKKSRKQPKQEFQLLNVTDMIGVPKLNNTNMIGNDILGTGSLGKLLKKEKKGKKNKGLIGENNIFKL